MVHVINNIPIYLPDTLQEIDEKSFRQYMMWQEDQKTLNKFPVTKFENALLATLPYTDENRPEEEKASVIPVGTLEFIVKTTPTKKRISYSTVYDKFKTFIQALEEFYNDERLRKDFRTLTPKNENITLELKELYVKNRVILEKIEEIKQASFEGKEGIKQEINLITPQQLLTEVPDVIQINLDRNYGAVAESNARTYQEALNMIEEGAKRTVGFKTKVDGKTVYVSRFKKLVLEDSLQIIGGAPKTVIAVMYPFENVSFKHQIEPREGTSYEPIISEFTKEAPEKLRSNSTIGDLVMVNMLATEAGKILKEKGIVKEEFLKDYDPQTEDGEMYIRIEGLKKRLDDYTKKNTTQNIEQNFSIILPRL